MHQTERFREPVVAIRNGPNDVSEVNRGVLKRRF